MDPPQDFISGIDKGDGVVVVSITGELDLSTAPALRARLLELCDSGDAVVLDLADVTFADSTALGVFVAAHKRLRGRGRMLVIANPIPGVRQIFEITNLDTVIPVFESRAEAVAQARPVERGPRAEGTEGAL